MEIVRRSDSTSGFEVLRRRWVVERTSGWLHNFRRLSKDYEYRTDSSGTFILIAALKIITSRLAG
jgi:putative transposase